VYRRWPIQGHALAASDLAISLRLVEPKLMPDGSTVDYALHIILGS